MEYHIKLDCDNCGILCSDCLETIEKELKAKFEAGKREGMKKAIKQVTIVFWKLVEEIILENDLYDKK